MLPNRKVNVIPQTEVLSVMRQFTMQPQFRDLRFARVETREQCEQVRQFRKRVYAENLKYMLNQMGESGLDEYDSRSMIFAAWRHDAVAGTIRLTSRPFESEKYIEQASLENFLGENWKHNYLEWSRLLVDTSLKIKGLLAAMTIYAGLYALAYTDYTKYFGYTRNHVRRLFTRFQVKNEALQFYIPSRGEHSYLLLKGSFLDDYREVSSIFCPFSREGI